MLSGSAFSSQPTGLASAFLSNSPEPAKWIYVIRRFSQFIDNITLTPNQIEDGTTKHTGVRTALNRHYYDSASGTDNSFLIGSWGKHTRVRPFRDVDLIFVLPNEVYWRFELRTGNKQSQLLQEVKTVLAKTYNQTDMRGDGQVVVVPFATSPIEIAPGFRHQDGTVIVCDTHDGGRYTVSTAEAELADLSLWDDVYDGNVRRLARMFKQWQRHCSVPLKSFMIERLAVEFLQAYEHAKCGFFYYDWFCRDFLAYLISKANGLLTMPGTGEVVWLGEEWLSKARSAYGAALKACDYERENENLLAGLYWQDLFGDKVPSSV